LKSPTIRPAAGQADTREHARRALCRAQLTPPCALLIVDLADVGTAGDEFVAECRRGWAKKVKFVNAANDVQAQLRRIYGGRSAMERDDADADVDIRVTRSACCVRRSRSPEARTGRP